jgi:hypothetical protein
VSRVGAVGVSAGGLDVVTAYANDARDGHVWLDGGAVALSPLLDVAATLARLEHPRTCSTLNAVELTWVEHLALAGVGAATFFGGAALIETLEHERLDSRTAIAAGVGAASGLALGLLADALIDGDSATSEGCIGQSSIGALFQEILQQRWATLLALDEGGLRSSRPSAETVTFSDYLSLRVDPYYRQRGMNVARLTPQRLSLALEARAARAPGDGARLLLLGADDDPVTLAPALHELARRTASLPRVHVVPVEHGGHGAFWIVQPALTQQLFGMFFAASPE